ncbi:hypothetical protein ACFQRL_09575 [Microbacterium fluvii]|uniref:Uncharacterized protein n=1 Tax=Microbacterium fluvii TaxID=415215 RepID=A0ABW2HCY8_9MICO|nr:hypothetical protein [Microbacterium fluvii]MCU4672839.1 hypothetical protein [Microbacterium fluvii]
MESHLVEIVISGRLGTDLSAALGGFDLQPIDDGRTRIVGPVPDQARLMGLLDMLADLHIDVLSFQRLDGDEAFHPAGVTLDDPPRS